MNPSPILSSQLWVERLAWALMQFLWQGVLLAALYAAARRWMARSSPNARYATACLVLAAMVTAPVATFLGRSPAKEPVPPPDAMARILNPAPPQVRIGWLPSAVPNADQADAWIARAAPWIVATWLFGSAFFWIRLAGGWWMTMRMRSSRIQPAPPEWQRTLTHLAARIRLSRPVRLLVSTRTNVPTVVGWFRPVVLAPLGALSGLPPEHMEALLLHELGHIRRHDYLVNILQTIAEALLFYHPAVWWVSRQIRIERELCCDDLAVAASGDPLHYATALADLEACRPSLRPSVLAANGGTLSDRIAHLLRSSHSESRAFSAGDAAAGVFLVVVTACAVFGQLPDRPQFEVASVKLERTKTRSSAGMRLLPGGRLHVENLATRELIMNAYHVRDFQIIGGPAWLFQDGFDIEAKGQANATRVQTMLMLQSLLEDRFHLQYHRETRELPVLALTVARGGAKLPAPKEGGCLTPDATAPANPPGPLSLPPCGSLSMLVTTLGMNLRGGAVPMSELTQQLADVLGRPVLDRTGIAKPFDVNFVFTPDDTATGLMARWTNVQGHRETMAAASAAAAAGDERAAPSLLVALQEQLGLKLESTKGAVEVMVIDHVEKPAPN